MLVPTYGDARRADGVSPFERSRGSGHVTIPVRGEATDHSPRQSAVHISLCPTEFRAGKLVYLGMGSNHIREQCLQGKVTVSRAHVHASPVAIPLWRVAALMVVQIGTPQDQRGLSYVRNENPLTRVNDMEGERAGGSHGTRSWRSVSSSYSPHFDNGVPESRGATLTQAQRLIS